MASTEMRADAEPTACFARSSYLRFRRFASLGDFCAQREMKSITLTIAVALLLIQAVLLAYSATVYSPVYSEVGHLPAGLAGLLFGRFDLYPSNPPLVRVIGAVPVACAFPNLDWASYRIDPHGRPEVEVGRDFMRANGSRSLWFYTLARWAIMPVCLLGGAVCFLWGRELYGAFGGLLAQVLWTFCPNVLGYGSLVMPDVPAASCGVAASYAFYRWIKHPDWRRAAIAGGILGVAELTKFTLLVLYPVWLLVWLAFLYAPRRAGVAVTQLGMLASIFGVSILVVNAGYEFRGSCRSLGTYQFQSETLQGIVARDAIARSWLLSMPVPLPEDYVRGIDLQRRDFEQGFPSYLCGEWRQHGWWYFYLYALLIKAPLGYWIIILLACACTLLRVQPFRGHEELALLAPGLTLLAFVSSQTGFSIHMRYVLPALPYFFIWAGKLGQAFESRKWHLALPSAIALVWAMGSSLAIYPNSLSYFNELAGGSAGGPKHLLDSNISWGQDLFSLKKWIDSHPEARPLRLAYFGYVEPRLVGIDYELPPMGPADARNAMRFNSCQVGPAPGWHAVDVNFIYGNCSRVQDENMKWRDFPAGLDFTYFQRFQPVARVGGSFWIYRITLDEANSVRMDLGLPELKIP